MAQMVTKYAAKKMLGKQMEKYKKKDVTPYDPYYENIPHPRKPGKTKKVKRQIPDYIPEHDAVILAKMRQRAYMLDCSLFNLFGVRFGWSSVLGLIPAAGDGLDGLLALLLVFRCSKIECGLGSTTMFMMLLNVAFDFLIGLVPIVGDIADAGFRANSKNVRLLEERLDKAYKPEAQRKRDRDSHIPPATVYEDFSDEDSEKLPRHRQDTEITVPEHARVPTEARGGERTEPVRKGTLKKSGSKKERTDEAYYAHPSDIEAQPGRSNTKKSTGR